MIDSQRVYFKTYWRSVILLYLVLLIDIVLLNRGMTYLPTICWIIVCAYTLFQGPEMIILEMFLIAPVTHAFQLSSSITTFPIMAIVLVVKLLFRNHKIEKNFLLAYLTLVAINFFSSFIQYGTFKYVLPFFVYYLMVYLVSRNLNFSEQLYEICLTCFVISVIIVCFGSKLAPVAADFMNNSTEYTVRNCGFSNVWDFGQNISISMTILLVALKRGKVSRILAIALFAVLSYFLIETGLYTALVGIAVAILLFPFLDKGNSPYSAKDFIFSITVVVVAALVGYYVIYPNMFALRAQVSDNGRFELWGQYIDLFCSNTRITLFGIGADSISVYAGINNIRTAHNAFIEKFVEFGVVGLSLLIAGLKSIMRYSSFLPTRNYRVIYAVAFLSMGMLQGISGAEVMFFFIILACWKEDNHEVLSIETD